MLSRIGYNLKWPHRCYFHAVLKTLAVLLTFVLTNPAYADAPVVRVLLTSKPVAEFTIGFDTPATANAVNNSGLSVQLAAASKVTVTASDNGFAIGDAAVNSPDVEVAANSNVIRSPQADYRGRIRFHRSGANRFHVVNVVSLDDYLPSVLDGEMPIEFGVSARMAQSVAARSFVLYHIAHAHPKSHFDVHASVQSQKYPGMRYLYRGRWLSGETSLARKTVEATAGLVIVRQGKLVCTYFSACCGGKTTRGEYFPGCQLTSVRCDHCRECPRFRWEESKRLTDVSGRIDGQSFDELLSIARSSAAGGKEDAFDMHFRGGKRVRLTRTQIRAAFFARCPSDRYELNIENEFVHITGRGHGHGVGLCQWGARGMSQKGRTCLEILRHYYPKTEVVRLKYTETSVSKVLTD